MGNSKKDNDKKKGRSKMSAEEFEEKLGKLQVELCHLQSWVVREKKRVIVVFEGRDAAGKGGVIKRIRERVNPRVFRTVALPKPSDREKSQLYVQRYISNFPSAGEIVLFDRSWYNRAGVEKVMGFCTDKQYERFLKYCPYFERQIVEDGIILIKYFLDVSPEVQKERFLKRAEDPLRQWKLSPMDIESYRRWWDYTAAYDRMINETDTPYAPWHCVPADDKRAARLNCIAHLLDSIPYKKVPFETPELGDRYERKDGTPDSVRFLHVVRQRDG